LTQARADVKTVCAFLLRPGVRDGIGVLRSLTTLREKLVKIGAKVVRHSRYMIFQFAEAAIPRRLFATILGRIQALAFAPG